MIEADGTVKCDNPNCGKGGKRKVLGIYRDKILTIFCPRCRQPTPIKES